MARPAHLPRTNHPIGPRRPRAALLAAACLSAVCLSAAALGGATETTTGNGTTIENATSPAPTPAAVKSRWQQITGLDAEAAEPMLCGNLFVWNSGRGIHAVRLSDGRPPWKDAPNATDSLIFPRGVSARMLRDSRAAAQTPLPAAVAGARVFAVLDGLSARDEFNADAALVCLDMSSAAEGRLAWIAPPPLVIQGDGPPQPTSFDGPPTADAQLVVCVVRSRVPSDWLYLAAFDARDGRPIWTRPLGSAIATDGIDHAARRRTARLQEDRIGVDTLAGTVATFRRDGRPMATAPPHQEKP